MRVGVLGVGRIGTFHAQTLAAHSGVERLVLYDADAARARDLASSLAADVAESPEELLGRVNAAVVAAPTAFNAELVHLCLSAGVPALCEKPVALDLADLNKVVEHADDAGVPLQVGFQRRFDAGYREARRLCNNGDLGRIYTFRLAGHDPAPPHADYIATSGGIFRDLHIHDFDAIRFVLEQEVEEVVAYGGVLGFPEFAEADDYDSTVASIRMADGTLGVLSGGRHDPLGYDIRMELFGSRDSISVGLDERTPLRSVEPSMRPFAGPPYPDFQHRFEDAYRAEVATFLEVAAGREDNPCAAKDAYEALRIATACHVSAHERRPVGLEEIA